jgi:xylose isomerase
VGVHVNDTYGTGDDDLAVGAVHLWSMVEFLLALEQVNYDGWLSLDLVPKRERAVDACTRSIKNLKNYRKMVSKMDRKLLSAAQAEQDALKAQDVVQDLLALD